MYLIVFISICSYLIRMVTNVRIDANKFKLDLRHLKVFKGILPLRIKYYLLNRFNKNNFSVSIDLILKIIEK